MSSEVDGGSKKNGMEESWRAAGMEVGRNDRGQVRERELGSLGAWLCCV